MSPALLFPAGLAALVALALPLLIHLARRTEERTTDFAALRWLSPSPKPRRRPRFDERLLLAIRLLSFGLLALWLAWPVLTWPAAREAWTVLVPGVAGPPPAGARWLAPGFPRADEAAPGGAVAVASLLRELDADLPAGVPLTVLVPAVIEGADAERPRLSRDVAWRVVPGRMTPARAAGREPGRLAMRGGEAAGGRFVRAAVAAIGGSAQGLVWWMPGEIPGDVKGLAERGGTVLVSSSAVLPSGPAVVVGRDAVGAPLAEAVRVGRGKVVRFVRVLGPEELFEAGFPATVRGLIAAPGRAPGRIFAGDYRPVRGQGVPQPAERRVDLRPWMAVLIAALLLVERWLATDRRRGATP